MISDHIFSDLKLYHTLHVFWLHTWIINFSSCMCQITTYFKDGKVLESTVSLFLDESNQLHPEHYLLLNIYYSGKQPQYIYIIRLQLYPESLVLDYLIGTAPLVFIPRVFPRP